ncbi:DUF6520 family protein [Flavobacterium sp. F52]|jgi:hypothetical protein|uniref:DUF6520 family protein n=1 Tax=Flavobacterium sp. F52 TaxID=1202532 RepID=UPI0002730CA0|nr:DUF6520 family protein [Flavobacterium sp. F52]EJG02039.1 hypothetical protein FF52_08524 [Flavobacterium sp. F52]
MKTTILKMALPVAAFILASAGAVSTAKDGDSLALLNGYRLTGNPSQPCEYVKMCSDVQGQFCTVNGTPTGQRLWHQPNTASPCNIVIYEP